MNIIVKEKETHGILIQEQGGDVKYECFKKKRITAPTAIRSLIER